VTALDQLRTPRLLLSRPSTSDLHDLIRFNQDARVMATLGGVRSRAETEEYLQRQLDHWERYGFGWWIARDAQTECFAGRGGLRRLAIGGRDEVEVGYSFLPEFWGHGLATELARESARVGFAKLHLPELVSFTLATNDASRRVMEKVGFRYERDLLYADLPHVLYRLTSAAWNSGGRDD